MKLYSPAFKEGEEIPALFTCDGKDVNPPFCIENIPVGTRSLALTFTDPDSTFGFWVHWVIYNIPVTGTVEQDSTPGVQGINDFKKKGYGGPCPRRGSHRYVFSIYALDCVLALKEGIELPMLQGLMRGHVLAEARCTGTYHR